MSARTTSFRFAQGLRTAAVAVAGLAAVAIVVLGVTARFHDVVLLGTLVAATLGFGGIFVGYETQPVGVKLRELTPNDRARALALAWGRIAHVDLAVIKWGAGGVLGATALNAIGSLALNDTRNAQVGLAVAAAILPTALAYVRHAFYAAPFHEKVALRVAGVAYVRAHAEQWTKTAADLLSDRATSCFRQMDPAKAIYPFWLPQEDSQSAPDMPPRYVNYMHLAVGEFVGVRSGPFLDIKETAERQAGEAEPDELVDRLLATGEDNKLLIEREAHYADIVNIEYKRADATLDGAPTGMFELGLTNGVRIDYVTLESGPPIKAAIENIRNRTRQAKAR